MSSYLSSFFERLFFKPNLFDWVSITLLSPLSLLYGSILLTRRLITPKKSYPLPIISVGNLIVGGSGKTPFVISLASRYNHVTIISRGYGRESRGLIEVSREGKIVSSVFESGDEAMLMAKSLPKASVIVSENRHSAIELAINNGAEVVILDDGFNRVEIKKFEILLFPKEIKNYFTFPAGPFREFFLTRYFAHLTLYEERDFKRIVKIKDEREKMLLATAISNPARLESYLPSQKILGRYYLADHAYFDESALKMEMNKYGATSLLVTEKDAVKMEEFKLPLSVMQLKLEIKNEILREIDTYIGAFNYEE